MLGPGAGGEVGFRRALCIDYVTRNRYLMGYHPQCCEELVRLLGVVEAGCETSSAAQELGFVGGKRLSIPPELGQLTSLVNLQLNQIRSTGSGRAEFRIDICLQSRDRQLGASHPRFCDR